MQQSGNAAVGLPASVDDGQTSPFTPPFHAASITIIGAGGHITLHTYDDPRGSLKIAITDTGIGIDATAMGKIFDAFEQGEKAVSRQSLMRMCRNTPYSFSIFFSSSFASLAAGESGYLLTMLFSRSDSRRMMSINCACSESASISSRNI